MLRFFLLFLFVMYVWNPQFFERNFLLNEIISLYGILVFFKNYKFFISNSIVRSMIPFAVLFLLYWFFSIFLVEDFYVYVRRLSILYSMFAMFAVYDLAGFLRTTRFKWIWIFPVQKVNLVFSYMYIASSLTSSRVGYWLMVFGFISTYTFIFGGSTAIFSCLIVFFFLSFPRVFGFIISLFVLFVFFAIFEGYFENINYFSNIYDYMDAYYLLSFDGNFAVRLFMWKYMIINTLFDSYGLGLGFGTEIFDEDYIRFLGLKSQLLFDSRLVYTLSPHNSFVFIFATMGIPGLASLIYIYYKLFKDHKVRVLNGLCTESEYRSFTFFLAFSVAAGLNVILESPVHSGLFWGILGLYLWERAQGGKEIV